MKKALLKALAFVRQWCRRLVFGCWFDHGDMVRERKGRTYAVVCERCGYRATFPRQRLKARRLNVVRGEFGKEKRA